MQTLDVGPPAARAYDLLGPVYDAYTDHPAYAGWVRRLERLARAHGLRGRRALDVGCGTGKSLLPLLELGYAATGCDPSEAMLAQARRKAGAAAVLHRAGLPGLPVLGAHDYVTCLNDVLNYVGARDLGAAVGALAANMAPGGVLVFDTSTLALYRALFARDHVRVAGDVLFAWRGATPEDVGPGDTARAWLDVVTPAGDGTHRREGAAQVQQHHPEARVRAAVEDAGLVLAAVLGQCDDGRPEPHLDPDRHTKAVWVAGRP